MEPRYSFSGMDNVNFQDFIRDFRMVAAINKYVESDLPLVLGAYLRGPALAFYKSIYRENSTFSEVCEAMSEEFPARVDYTELFYNVRQEKQEELIAYFYRLTDIAAKAGVTDERKFCKIFLKGLSEKFKNQLGAQVFTSKTDLRNTITQIKELFQEGHNPVVNLPIEPHPNSLRYRGSEPGAETFGTPIQHGPRSPVASPNTPTAEASRPGGGEQFRTPRYDFRRRNVYTNVHTPTKFQKPSHPNYRGRNQ